MKLVALASPTLALCLLACAQQPEPKAPSCLTDVPTVAHGPARMELVLDDVTPDMDPRRVGKGMPAAWARDLWKLLHEGFDDREFFFLSGQVYRMRRGVGDRHSTVTTVQRLPGGRTTLFVQDYPRYTAPDGTFPITTFARLMTATEWETLESLVKKSRFHELPYIELGRSSNTTSPGVFHFRAKLGNDYHVVVRNDPSGPLADVFRFLDCLSLCECGQDGAAP